MSGKATALKRATRLKEIMLAWGVPEVSIELQAGRPGPSDRWNNYNFRGEQSHHIASKPTVEKPTPGLSLVKKGRSDLVGPLANGTAGVDLVFRILTLGLANHPGVGGPLTLRGTQGAFTIPKNNGRPYLFGVEYEGGYTDAVWNQVYTNRRTGKKMSFHEFMARANGAILQWMWEERLKKKLDFVDLSAYHIEHSTWTSRKIDRRGYDATKGRKLIQQYAPKVPVRQSPMPTLRKLVRDEFDLRKKIMANPKTRNDGKAWAPIGASRAKVYIFPKSQLILLRDECYAKARQHTNKGEKISAGYWTEVAEYCTFLFNNYPKG